MKKYIALLLALVMLLLAACGTAQPPVDEQTPSTEVTEPSGTEAVQGDPTEDTTQPSTDEPTTEPTDPTGDSSGTDGTEETTEPTTSTESTEPSGEETEPTAPSVDKPTDPTDPTKPVEVTLTLNKTSISLEVGKSATLTASYNGTKSLSWSSSNTAVATVSNGKVTAKNAGTTTITVTDGNVKATCTVTVTKAVEPTDPPVEVSVKLNKTSLTLDVGDTATLTATTTGNGTLSWSSNNTSVATVSNGKVTAKAAGTAKITVSYGGKTATCTVTVNKVEEPTNPPVEVKLSLNKTSLTLEVGDTSTITATYSGASGKPSWSSSNTSVATVDSNGKVTAKAAGSAVISATYGGKTAQCVVTVNAKPVAVTVKLDKTSLTLDVGGTATLTATTTGSGTLSWSSSNTAVATVSNGKVTAKGAGTATITVSYGSATAKCTVTVNQPAEVTLKLNKRVLELDVGETYTLTATTTGSGTLSWSSSDSSVATVDSNGKVTAKAAGNAVISATFGGKTAQCIVDVYAVEESEPEIGPAVSVSKSGNNGSWDVGCVGNSLSFNAVAKTANGENRGVTASSSNTGVATVSCSMNSGIAYVTVSFKGSGSVTITLTSDDGKASTSFTINVRGYSAQNASTPEAFAAAATYVMNMNGCSTSAGGTYTVLTLSDSDLSWSRAVGIGQSTASRAWSNGSCAGSVTYEGVNEDGLHVFYLRST